MAYSTAAAVGSGEEGGADFVSVLATLAKTKITYPKNVRTKVAMDFT